MTWNTLADGVAILHAIWVGAVFFGPLLGYRKPFWRGVHLTLMGVTVLAWSFYCPLTSLENVLRARFDPTVGYSSGFLEHYLGWLFDLDRHRFAMAWGVRGWAGLWAIVYGVLWARELRHRPFLHRDLPPPEG